MSGAKCFCNFSDLHYDIYNESDSISKNGIDDISISVSHDSVKKSENYIQIQKQNFESDNNIKKVIFLQKFYLNDISKLSDRICKNEVNLFSDKNGKYNINDELKVKNVIANNLNVFDSGFSFYFKVKQLHTFKYTDKKSSCNSFSKLQSRPSLEQYIPNNYADFKLQFYDHINNNIGQISVSPNVNQLISHDFFKRNQIDINKIYYVRFSLILNQPCRFNLYFLTFSFVDYMSTNIISSRYFNLKYRLQVNNLKKKKNGVIIFFPSFYIQERDADSIRNNSIKWPNFTRHTWSRDLDRYCTIFVSDPFQFINDNTESSWFISPEGYSVLFEIAQIIREILELPQIDLKFCANDFELSADNENPSNLKGLADDALSQNNLSDNKNFNAKDMSSTVLPRTDSDNMSVFETRSSSVIKGLFKLSDKLGINLLGKCGPIISYGSSMGGYAAFLFSCYLKPDLCFAECPQANLTKYKYSLEYLKQYPELDYQKDIYNCLSFSKIIKEHKPEFKSLFHFYALDRLHLDNFNNEISQLTDEEIKKFNYSLVIENDVENGLSGHQAMPKEKVLKIFHKFLKR